MGSGAEKKAGSGAEKKAGSGEVRCVAGTALASSPGHQAVRKDGLVHTVCACAKFQYFSSKFISILIMNAQFVPTRESSIPATAATLFYWFPRPNGCINLSTLLR